MSGAIPRQRVLGCIRMLTEPERERTSSAIPL